MADGSSTIDFGATPTGETNITVTGQSGIAANAHVEAWFMLDTTVDNDSNAHAEAQQVCGISCGVVTPGDSFLIFVRCDGLATGQFIIHWVWKNP